MLQIKEAALKGDPYLNLTETKSKRETRSSSILVGQTFIYLILSQKERQKARVWDLGADKSTTTEISTPAA